MRGIMRIVAGAAVLALIAAGVPSRARAADVLVFAAASLKNAMDDAVSAFEKTGGDKVRVSYGASSALAKQIEAAAPADMFISADLDWMDDVEKRSLIQTGTRKNFLGNRLVLVEPATSDLKVVIAPNFPLAKLLGGGRLAMADPDAVPAGKYGKAALETLGVWSSVEGKLARAENVRAALFFVARGEAPLGIVYATDAAAEKAVKVAGVFPESTHPAIVYLIALTSSSKNPAAVKFLAFLESPAAKPLFERQGFTVLP
jgi:molybdate transport system substrate-binding protein